MRGRVRLMILAALLTLTAGVGAYVWLGRTSASKTFSAAIRPNSSSGLPGQPTTDPAPSSVGASAIPASAVSTESPRPNAILDAPSSEWLTPSPEPSSPSADLIAQKAALRAAYAAAPDIVWGVNGHPFTGYPNISMEDQLDALKHLGMTHYRINLRPSGSIEGLDRLLQLAESRGISLVPIIFPDASFERDTVDRIYAQSYAVGRSLAKRYRGRIRVWELGNEFENFAIIQPCEMRDDGTQYPCEWGPAGGVGELEYFGPRWRKVSAALHGLSDGVRAGDPSALRALGTAGWGHLGAFDRLAKDGIQWDISVWHQYTPGGDDAFQRIARFGKPIWITEFNFESGSTNGEEAQTRGLMEMMTRHREIRVPYGVEAVFIYELFDEPYWTGPESRMGLIHLRQNSRGFWKIGEPKQAYEAVRQLIARGAQGAVPPSLQ